MTDALTDPTETVLVMNPQSGDESHAERVRDRADLAGYEVHETDGEGHAVELASAAAAGGAEDVVAVGGDGTLNEVVRGVSAADALGDVALGVVPAGTGNDFATNVGIDGIDEGFEAVENGERRRIDLGIANDRPFLNSCIAGLTAEASDRTPSSLKARFGVLAYVVTTLRTATSFPGIDIEATVAGADGETTLWEGTAAIVVVGNARRFSGDDNECGDLEDGRLEVTIIEDAGSVDLARDRLLERLFDAGGERLDRFRTSSLDLEVVGSGSATFSLDGEILDRSAVSVRTRHRAVEFCVGDEYERSDQRGRHG